MHRALTAILDKGQSRSYNAGSTILYQGEVPRGAFILTEGVAKSFNISHQGEEQIFNFHIEGDILAPSWVFKKTSGAVHFYEAVTDCKLHLIQRDVLMEYIDSNQHVTKFLLDRYITDYTASLIRVTALEQAKASDKLLYTFYYLSRLYGQPKGVSSEITLKLTHQSIASLVGLTRETVAVELNKLRRKKIINYSNQRYSVHSAKLLEAMGEDSFKGINLRYSSEQERHL